MLSRERFRAAMEMSADRGARVPAELVSLIAHERFG
jgi:hypothetical protein